MELGPVWTRGSGPGRCGGEGRAMRWFVRRMSGGAWAGGGSGRLRKRDRVGGGVVRRPPRGRLAGADGDSEAGVQVLELAFQPGPSVLR